MMTAPLQYASGYRLDLYCDRATRADGVHSFGEFPRIFTGETFAECARHARAAGWVIHRATRTATCPRDHRVRKLKAEREATTQDLARAVAHGVRSLDRSNYPPAGICQHHGVHVPCGQLQVAILGRSGRLLVTVYQSTYLAPSTVHASRAAAIAKALDATIFDYWNGREGHDGISVVFDRPCPESLLVAIGNYVALPDVFRISPAERARFDEFGAWYREGLAR
jgi:hypothetical protein